MLRAVVYTRKSSADEDEDNQKFSLERQERDIDAYFAKNVLAECDGEGLLRWNKEKNVDFFFEDASAKKITGRIKFNRMLDLIRSKKFDVLMCTDLSRLSRNAIDTGRVVQLLEDGFLKEIRTKDKIFSSNATDKFTLALFLSVAKYENDQRAVFSMSGSDRKRDDGGTTYKAPFPYKNIEKSKGVTTVVKSEPNFSNTRQLIDMLLTRKYSMKEIYARKDALGIQHFYKKKTRLVSDGAVRGLFGNPYVTGRVKVYDRDSGLENWVEGEHPALVTQAEFDEMQAILQSLNAPHAPISREYDVGDLIKMIAVSGEDFVLDENGDNIRNKVVYESRFKNRCATCKKNYYGQCFKCPSCGLKRSKDTKTYAIKHFYFSKNNKKTVSLKKVINWLNIELNKIKISDGLFQVLKNKLYTMWLDEEKVFGQERKRLSRLIEEKIEKMENVKREKFERNDARETADANSVIDRLRDEKEDLEDEKFDLEEKHEDLFEQAWQRLLILRDAKSVLQGGGEFEPKKAILLSLCSNLILYKDHLEVEWQEPFDLLAKSTIDKSAGSAGPTNCKRSSLIGSPSWTNSEL